MADPATIALFVTIANAAIRALITEATIARQKGDITQEQFADILKRAGISDAAIDAYAATVTKQG